MGRKKQTSTLTIDSFLFLLFFLSFFNAGVSVPRWYATEASQRRIINCQKHTEIERKALPPSCDLNRSIFSSQQFSNWNSGKFSSKFLGNSHCSPLSPSLLSSSWTLLMKVASRVSELKVSPKISSKLREWIKQQTIFAAFLLLSSAHSSSLSSRLSSPLLFPLLFSSFLVSFNKTGRDRWD